MTANPVTVGADAPLDEIVQLMEKHNIKRVPVVQRGKVVGMVTRANIVRALVSVQREAATQANNDLKIKKQILADIARQGWSYGASIDVVVRHGIVNLWGTLVDPAQRKALNVLVSNTPGASGR
jgi:predicted transcriptional regulator